MVYSCGWQSGVDYDLRSIHPANLAESGRVRKHPEASGIMTPMGNSSMCTQQVRQPSKRRLGRRLRRPDNITTAFLLLLLALFSCCCHCQATSKNNNVTDVYSNLTFTRGRYNASIYENNIGKSYVTPEERYRFAPLPPHIYNIYNNS